MAKQNKIKTFFIRVSDSFLDTINQTIAIENEKNRSDFMRKITKKYFFKHDTEAFNDFVLAETKFDFLRKKSSK